jgi:hypothetical protein
MILADLLQPDEISDAELDAIAVQALRRDADDAWLAAAEARALERVRIAGGSAKPNKAPHQFSAAML